MVDVLKGRILAVLDEVAAGEEVVITKHGRAAMPRRH